MKRRKFHKPKRTTYPLATVIPYGPNDKTVTKLVVAIIPDENDPEPAALERWMGVRVADDRKVAQEMYDFMRYHGVKTVSTATAIMGCPHEEGDDFPQGEDCPFCPFWKGMQGSGSTDERWNNLKSLRLERLEPGYKFWLPF